MKKIPALRIFNISFSARTLQDRTYIWKTAFMGFKEKPIFGWRPAKFSYVFDSHFPKELFAPPGGTFGAWFDRAHSVFFDYLVETGVLGLLSYLAVFFVFYVQLFKKKINLIVANKKEEPTSFSNKEYFTKLLIFAIPIAYLVQGLVLFEVLVIYLNLFLFFAFVNYKFNKERLEQAKI